MVVFEIAKNNKFLKFSYIFILFNFDMVQWLGFWYNPANCHDERNFVLFFVSLALLMKVLSKPIFFIQFLPTLCLRSCRQRYHVLRNFYDVSLPTIIWSALTGLYIFFIFYPESSVFHYIAFYFSSSHVILNRYQMRSKLFTITITFFLFSNFLNHFHQISPNHLKTLTTHSSEQMLNNLYFDSTLLRNASSP